MEVIVNMACGLANRMFQYSYYLYLKSLGWQVKTDFYRKSKLAHENVDWERIFPQATFEQASQVDVLMKGGGAYLLSKIRRRYLPWTTQVIEMPTAFTVKLPSKSGQYIMGVFQNADIVEAIKDKVLDAFTFRPFISGENARLMNEMRHNELSVGIHVRKGKDYVNRRLYQNTCTVEYYMKAVTYLKKKLGQPTFYVFTDSPEWVKDNMTFFNYTLVSGNPCVGWGSHFDMQLMSYCHHNIISNSTYSWWGAFLNKNKGKIVICPRAWFNPEYCQEWESTPVRCQDWIVL